MPTGSSIAVNRRSYRLNRPKLASDAQARHASVVLMHDGEVVDYFTSEIDAAREGIRRYGSEPFYVRDLAADEEAALVASNFAT